MSKNKSLNPNATVFLFVVTSYSYFISHRIPAYKSAVASGFDVHLICKLDSEKIYLKNITIHDFDWKRNNLSPIQLVLNILKLKKKINYISPDIIYNVALQPIFFNLIACRFSDIKIINGVMGFGILFHYIQKKKLIYLLLKIFFKFFLRRKSNFFLFKTTVMPLF